MKMIGKIRRMKLREQLSIQAFPIGKVCRAPDQRFLMEVGQPFSQSAASSQRPHKLPPKLALGMKYLFGS